VVVRPVVGVGEHNLGALFDVGPLKLALGRGDDRVELLEVAALGVIWAATRICSSVTAAWAL
jgi:hypothetical protein